jgi:hypothetical protein
MDDVGRLLTLLAIAGLALTLAGSVVLWHRDEARRLRRSLKKVLGAAPDPVLVARGRGRGLGIDFATARIAVSWNAGAWCLVYGLSELQGLELILDDQVAARVHRGEPRRALDRLSGAQDRVRLRFLFDDMRYPDFDLDLWCPDDEGRRHRLTAAEALEEAARWLARIDSALRRPSAQRAEPTVARPAAEPPPFDLDEDEEDDANAA